MIAGRARRVPGTRTGAGSEFYAGGVIGRAPGAQCGLRVEVEAKGCFDVLQGLSEGAAEWRGVPAAGVGRQRDAERAIGKASEPHPSLGGFLAPGVDGEVLAASDDIEMLVPFGMKQAPEGIGVIRELAGQWSPPGS